MSNSDVLSVEQFRAAFRLDPNPWPQAEPERALIQLGLPSPTCVSMWLAPEQGKALEPTLWLPDNPGITPRLVATGALGTMRVDLDGLSPDTSYVINVRTSADATVQSLRASTAPGPTKQAFSFLASSCFAPYAPRGRFGAFIEGSFWPNAGDGSARPHLMRRTAHVLRLLEQTARARDQPAFLLALGDQIYVDAGESAGQAMLGGTTSTSKRYAAGDVRSFFETIYRATFSLEPYAAALQALPSAMMWDDHEIRDGWGSQGDEESEDWRQHLTTAREYFVAWQGARNPPRGASPASAEAYLDAARVGAKLTRNPEHDFSFDWGREATFFVMDLRSCRNVDERRVVSNEQLNRLETWFASRDDSPTVWVLGSPLPLCHDERWFDWLQRKAVKSRKDDMLDAWWSEPLSEQRERVFRIIEQHFRTHTQHRLLVLSGDVHFSELLELSDSRGRVFGHEIVSSGLAQTYFKRLRGRTPRDTKLPYGIAARGLGRFHGPAFAEVFVQPGSTDQQPPCVSVTFHTSVEQSGKYLANVSGPSAKRLELPLTRFVGKHGQRDELFECFIVTDPEYTSATAIEPASNGRTTT
jgi:PhoD-like phosphatase